MVAFMVGAVRFMWSQSSQSTKARVKAVGQFLLDCLKYQAICIAINSPLGIICFIVAKITGRI